MCNKTNEGFRNKEAECPVCKAKEYPYPTCGHVKYVEKPNK